MAALRQASLYIRPKQGWTQKLPPKKHLARATTRLNSWSSRRQTTRNGAARKRILFQFWQPTLRLREGDFIALSWRAACRRWRLSASTSSGTTSCCPAARRTQSRWSCARQSTHRERQRKRMNVCWKHFFLFFFLSFFLCARYLSSYSFIYLVIHIIFFDTETKVAQMKIIILFADNSIKKKHIFDNSIKMVFPFPLFFYCLLHFLSRINNNHQRHFECSFVLMASNMMTKIKTIHLK